MASVQVVSTYMYYPDLFNNVTIWFLSICCQQEYTEHMQYTPEYKLAFIIR